MPNLFFLHGFSGDPHDWSEVIAHLPEYPCYPLTYPFEFPAQGILIGYSMGGRIALTSGLPKIILSGHPGLRTDEEKQARLQQEAAWIQKLQTVTLPEFFDAWYAQPLFDTLRKHPRFPSILQKRLSQDPQLLIQQLKNHSLAHQPSLIRNAVFLHGEYDTSYRDLYKKFNIPSHAIPQAGHAVHLENPAATANQIKIIIDSFN